MMQGLPWGELSARADKAGVVFSEGLVKVSAAISRTAWVVVHHHLIVLENPRNTWSLLKGLQKQRFIDQQDFRAACAPAEQ